MTIVTRLKKLTSAIKGAKLDGYLIENSIDLMYFTGLKLSSGLLLITKQGYYLFVDGRYIEKAKAAKNFKAVLLEGDNFQQHLKILGKGLNARWGFDPKKMTFDRYRYFKKCLSKVKVKLQDIEGLCDNIRSIKEPKEIKILQKSSDLLIQSYEFLKTQIKVGVQEKKLAKAFEIFALSQGADGLSFEPIIAFNESASMPHHRASDKVLKKNSLILIDIGLIVDGYASDMTRVLFFGKADPKLKKAYEVLREVHESILKKLKPGVALCELDLFAKEELAKKGYEGLMTHSLGHGVGLEVHEFPRISSKTPSDIFLKENMVITIEPGIYFPGIGGVRYEDLVVITKNGYNNFYRNLNSDKVALTIKK